MGFVPITYSESALGWDLLMASMSKQNMFQCLYGRLIIAFRQTSETVNLSFNSNLASYLCDVS